jgi:Fic family protein
MAKPVAYHLGKFPPPALQWEALIPLLGPANAGLARYDGLLQAIPNPSVLLAPLSMQEAVLSSRIEGTQATASEVFEFEADEQRFAGERRNDIVEVLNYRRALSSAVKQMEKLPLSQRILLASHRQLMAGVRGANKAPGEYRRIENWIGPPGCTQATARFLPPAPQLLPDLMGEWERYIHSDVLDRLVQLAIVHAEFEALHPFLDGNGRLGRMVIPLFLVEKKLLSSPNFYMSAYFEQDKQAYYDALLAVSATGDWTGWCRFFLMAITAQAADNEKRARSILHLYNQMKERVVQLTHSQHAILALDFIFQFPTFTSPSFVAKAGIPAPTANRILRLMRDEGILKVVRESAGRSPAILRFSDLLDRAEGVVVDHR